MISWEEIEEKYAKNFTSKQGAPAKSARMALAALIIKEKLRLTDEDTVQLISETPAMQYFLGMEKFVQKAPFDPSSMVHFRKRFSADFIEEINQMIIREGKAKLSEKPPEKEIGQGPPSKTDCTPKEVNQENSENQEKEIPRQGKLILDAACAPADIRYPADLGLLNKAGEKSEEIIDTLFGQLSKKNKKPRTYRRKARKQYLNLARKKRLTAKSVRKGCGQQLRYLKKKFETH